CTQSFIYYYGRGYFDVW
nr:immunoglobulin heavy chain junction region [Mus musculus]MBK4198678.1 immunoglobulin heavy chain junction region [Mus musculus]